MTWTCPQCKRSFANQNQWHSCVEITVDTHFINKDPWLKTLYDQLICKLKKFGDFQIEAVQSAIMLKQRRTFVAIRVMKQCLEINFGLDQLCDEFPVYKTARISKNLWEHRVRIDGPEQIDTQLLGWLHLAYRLNA